jgi:hypothetical protein
MIGLVAIENQMKKRGSGGFARYLVGILVGVAATVAWQSYGVVVRPSALKTLQARTGYPSCARERRVESARAFHRPGGGASNSDGPNRAAAKRGADHRQSRPYGARGR